MTSRHILSSRAETDLQDIHAYGFAHFGRERAAAYILGLGSAFELIAAYRHLGRIDTAFTPVIHRFEHAEHIILYDTYESHIVIVRVLHKAADMGAHTNMER